MDVYLGLGSNLGDRRRNILDAVDMLDDFFGVGHDALSTLIETEPWGFDSDDKFLNAVVRYDAEVPRGTDMEDFCISLLDACKDIEVKLGRTDLPEYDMEGRRHYSSRTIDIDILTVGDFEMRTERLTIPHPLMTERDFVMVPLSEICKGQVHLEV